VILAKNRDAPFLGIGAFLLCSINCRAGESRIADDYTPGGHWSLAAPHKNHNKYPGAYFQMHQLMIVMVLLELYFQ